MTAVLTWIAGCLMVMCGFQGVAMEVLELDVIAYEDFVNRDANALQVLRSALYEKGIVGIRGVPGYREKAARFIEMARSFVGLPEEVKGHYAPDRERGDMFLGYESGKERFKRPDGSWVIDDLKVSYYGFIPEQEANRWPVEVDLKGAFQDLGVLMREVGKAVMEAIGLVGPKTGISVDEVPAVGRMLYYRKDEKGIIDNPFWCGAHFDHGLFTALLPASYFCDGKLVCEPEEAGLFVRPAGEKGFKKVIADDPEVLLFQVGEFGQLATDDAIKATEHRVCKALGPIERYTMAVFFEPPAETVLHSTSELALDERYGGVSGDACSYKKWSEGSFKRYLVTEE